jgi:hypothetical protein
MERPKANRAIVTDGVVPTKEDIDGLEVGSKVLNIFGEESEVTRITYRGTDINGKRYVCYYECDGSGEMSSSMKEGEAIKVYFPKAVR